MCEGSNLEPSPWYTLYAVVHNYKSKVCFCSPKLHVLAECSWLCMFQHGDFSCLFYPKYLSSPNTFCQTCVTFKHVMVFGFMLSHKFCAL